ncbi:hypothetical protein MAR_010683 [Mya arenaria]|uniref:Uncharacterized protein n=1 Tax=Mya arenaria TaxID=6604 RepID=A0ABY7FVQ2_MYAAR|nr:hypothetical protein MAR_010683 [Mya arenaria]
MLPVFAMYDLEHATFDVQMFAVRTNVSVPDNGHFRNSDRQQVFSRENDRRREWLAVDHHHLKDRYVQVVVEKTHMRVQPRFLLQVKLWI